MKSETKINHWLEIQEIVRKDFLKALSKEEIIQLVKALKIDIRGFSKRVENAPPFLLKNSLEKDFKKIKLKSFLKSYVPDSYQDLKDEEYETGIKRIASDSRLSQSEVIAIVAILYPKKYEKLRQHFTRNIGDEANPLRGIIDFEAKDILETLISTYEKLPQKLSEKSDKKFENVNLESIKDNFISDYELEKSIAFDLFIADKIDEISLDSKDRKKIMELAIYELIEKQIKLFKDIGRLKEEKEEQEDELHNLKKENERNLAKLEKNLEQEKEKYEKELKKKEEKIKEMSDQHETILKGKNSKKNDLQTEIDNLREEVEILKTSIVPMIEEIDQVLIFTERKEAYENLVDQTSLQSLEETKNIENHLTKKKYFFLDGFGMTTADKRKIRKISSKHDIKINLLSGQASRIVRKIIFHIEGEGLY